MNQRKRLSISRITILLLFILSHSYLTAQDLVFAKRAGSNLGSEQGWSIAVDNENNTLVTGNSGVEAVFGKGETNETTLPSNSRAFLAKYEEDGSLIWVVPMGSSNNSITSYAVDTDQNSNIYISGTFFQEATFGEGQANETTLTGTSGEIFLAKYNTNGDLAWALNIGGDQDDNPGGRDLVVTPTGDIYVTGSFWDEVIFGAGEANETTLTGVNLDIFVAKFNTDGLLKWVKQAGGSSFESVEAISMDKEENIYITGGYQSLVIFEEGESNETFVSRGYLAKYDKNGNFLSAFSLFDGDLGGGRDIFISPEGDIFITGYFVNSITFDFFGDNELTLNGSGNDEFFIAKYDSNENFEWAQTANSAGGDRGYALALDEHSNVFVSGYYGDDITFDEGGANETMLNHAGSSDLFFAKYSTNGKFRWATSAGGTDWEQGTAMEVDNDGNSLLTGFYRSNLIFGSGESNETNLTVEGTQDIFIAKFKTALDLVSDSLALVALYNATDGPNWSNNTNWLTGDVNTWYGITVTGNRITEINLAINNLSGVLPADIGDLTALEKLFLGTGSEDPTNIPEAPLDDANRNEISGNLPNNLWTLTELKVLDLNSNDITGTVPEDICDLAKLTHLDLAHNELTGSIPQSIEELTSLVVLELYANFFSGSIPTNIGNLTGLSHLRLGSNIGSRNDFTGGIPASLWSLTNLETLNLRLNENLEAGNLPIEIGDLTNLRNIDLATIGITGSIPTEIGNLTSLEYFQAQSNTISGSIPTSIGNLVNLKWLWLFDNDLSGSIPTEIGSATSLEQLRVGENSLSGSIPNSIGNLTSLNTLHINGNNISGTLPSEIISLSSLQDLDLRSNNIQTLPDLSSLSLLNFRLSQNELSFVSLEPNFLIVSGPEDFDPAPLAQKNFGIPFSRITSVNEPFTLASLLSSSSANDHYQWRKDGVDIPGANDLTLELDGSVEDVGIYNLLVTNSIVTGVTLSSSPIDVQVQAPLNETDSLTLVNFYFSLDGPNWNNNTNWLNGNVETWNGVTINGGRITEIQLENNKLKGVLPQEFTNLDALRVIDFDNNDISELPDLSGLSKLTKFEVRNNLLTFEDLVPNVSVLTGELDQKLFDNDRLKFFVETEGRSVTVISDFNPAVGDMYQWTKAGFNIVGASAPTIVIDNLMQSDVSFYTLKITNTNFPGLTLSSATYLVRIVNLPYIENFDEEVFDQSSNLWTFGWEKNFGDTPSIGTGPSSDQGSQTGFFMYSEANDAFDGFEDRLVSPAINVSSLSNPTLTFYYHMFGSDINELEIGVLDQDQNYTKLETITGQQQSSSEDPYKIMSIPLSGVATGQIQVDFRARHNGGEKGDIAIDNVSVTGGFLTDLMVAVITGVNYQENTKKTVGVTVLNKGASGSQSFSLSLLVNGEEIQSNDLVLNLNQNETYQHTFNSPVDFSSKQLYNLKAQLDFAGDQNQSNNELSREIVNLPFTGNYTFEQTADGAFGKIFTDNPTFNSTLIYIDENTRAFAGDLYDVFIDNWWQYFEFDFSGGSTTFQSGQNTGLSCVTQLVLGTADTPGSYKLEDYSKFSLIIKEDETNDCGAARDITFNVTRINRTPQDISLSSNSQDENTSSGSIIGHLSTTDSDLNDSFTYTISGTDAMSFQIGGTDKDELQNATELDFEAQNGFSITITSTDGGGETFSEDFTLTINDVNEPPSSLTLSNSSISENDASNSVIGNLSATDPEGKEITFTISGIEAASFQISGSVLHASGSFDFETQSSFSITITATDSDGMSISEDFTITVNDVNEAPSAVALDNTSITENLAVGSTIGNLSATDPDAGDTFSYSVAGTDAANFQISGSELQTASVFDFEGQSSYSITVTATDAGGLAASTDFNISVTNVNEAVTSIALSSNEIEENAEVGATIGTLIATDPEGDEVSFTLTSDPSGQFDISGLDLIATSLTNITEDQVHEIIVSATDPAGLSTEVILEINVIAVEEDVLSTPLEDHGLKVFPNPSNGFFSITLNEPVLEMDIIDLTGKKIDFNKVINEGRAEISIKDAADGIYLLEITTTQGIYSQRVNLNRD